MGSKNLDRLSNMPEEILSEILSLIPTKYAVQTSILSKRWRYNWTLVTSIDISFHPFNGFLNCCALVDRVLDLCKTTEIKLCRLRFSNLWVEKSRMTKWIDEAIRLKVKELDIECGLLKLPLSMLNCNTLTKLTINIRDSIWQTPFNLSTPFNLPCVKSLDIYVCSAPSRNVLKLIRGCRVLESLSLEWVVCNQKEEFRFNIPTLKQLKLRTNKGYFSNKVVLNVPNLEDLLIISAVCHAPFVMEDLSSLVSVTFSLSLNPSYLWVELLKGIIRAKSLSLHMRHYVDLPEEPLLNLPNLKHLKLTDDGYKFEKITIFKFLESCSELEHLSFETEDFDAQPDSCWFKPHPVPTCMLKTLRTIKFVNCKGWMDDIQFLEYMLGNAEVLQTLTITWNSKRVKDETRLCSNLLKCPRASRYCEIHFVGKSSDSASS